MGLNAAGDRSQARTALSVQLQFEAAFAALDSNEAQQRRELLLVLGADARIRQKRGIGPLLPRALPVKPKRTLQGAQVRVQRSAFTVDLEFIVTERRNRRQRGTGGKPLQRGGSVHGIAFEGQIGNANEYISG